MLALGGCSEMISFNRTLPAEMIINPKESIFITNNFDYTQLDFNSGEEKKQEVYRSGINSLLQSMGREFTNKNEANITLSDTEVLRDTLSENFSLSLCETSKTDFLLLVDDYNLIMDQNKCSSGR